MADEQDASATPAMATPPQMERPSPMVKTESSVQNVLSSASEVVSLASELGSTLKRGDGVRIDDLSDKARRMVDTASCLPSEVGRAACGLRDDLRHTWNSSVPTPREVAATVYRAEVPAIVAQSPLLLGLFVPPPEWPARPQTVGALLRGATLPAAIVGGALAFALFVLCIAAPLLASAALVLSPLLVPLVLYGRHRRGVSREVRQRAKAAAEAEAATLDRDRDRQAWRDSPAAFFSTETEAARLRRRRVAESMIASIASRSVGHQPSAFNRRISSTTSLAVYGCGVVAATHVGALRALERHGLRYESITTLAGVSAGAIVVAMLAVGAVAEEINVMIQSLNFSSLVTPEVGALLRAGVNVATMLLPAEWARSASRSAALLMHRGHGPGINSGGVLESLVGEALRAKCGRADITMRQILERHGKRLILIATELDTGKERRLTPETDPNLPVRVAVRMSMGIPGVFEPFKYEGHVYVDGGMINDFPVDALPPGDGRLGLCVKQKGYVSYHMGSVESIVGSAELESTPQLQRELVGAQDRLWRTGVYPTRDIPSLATTCLNVMMDANLDLQIEKSTERAWRASGEEGSDEDEALSPFTRRRQRSLFNLAPQILTLCSGGLQPFDFSLTREQHHELYLLGQLFAHLHASQHGRGDGLPAVMTDEQKAKTLLLMLYLD
jgi:predicted acylesterase/phospholipase RssA